jgi:hypothetical protein
MRGRRAGTGATRAPPQQSSHLAHVAHQHHKTDSFDTEATTARRRIVDNDDRDSTSSVLPQLPTIDDDDTVGETADGIGGFRSGPSSFRDDNNTDTMLSRESVVTDPLPRLPPN